ncbi:hypothetical protein ACN20G_23380 [Streptomyces sp. BI20]|uniref:hypothetical protein n=1 Tax=Streptomyces sp. BI20 TaxID=3403460 RepID=UPI003C7626FD
MRKIAKAGLISGMAAAMLAFSPAAFADDTAPASLGQGDAPQTKGKSGATAHEKTPVRPEVFKLPEGKTRKAAEADRHHNTTPVIRPGIDDVARDAPVIPMAVISDSTVTTTTTTTVVQEPQAPTKVQGEPVTVAHHVIPRQVDRGAAVETITTTTTTKHVEPTKGKPPTTPVKISVVASHASHPGQTQPVATVADAQPVPVKVNANQLAETGLDVPLTAGAAGGFALVAGVACMITGGRRRTWGNGKL